MKILHILSAEIYSGAIAYAEDICRYNDKIGGENYIIADKLFNDLPAHFYQVPISDGKFWSCISNKKLIKKIISDIKPDIVHCHPRSAFKLAYPILKNSNIPLITTIHGRQHIHFSSTHFDVTGDAVIAICSNLKSHLINELNVKESKITVIENHFNFTNSRKVKSEVPILSIIGRTNSIKGRRVSGLIDSCAEKLLKAIPNLKIRIIGGGISNFSPHIQAKIQELNQRYADRIENIMFTNTMADYIKESWVVISAGRCAIETLYLETPLIGMGESLYVGTVNENNFDIAKASNFGDISAEKNLDEFDYDKVFDDILHALSAQSTVNLSKLVIDNYSADRNIPRIFDIYKTARMKKVCNKYIPTLIYHQVTKTEPETKYKIYTPSYKLEQHLKYLKMFGYTTITFQDYYRYREGLLPLYKFPKKPIILTFDDGYEDNYTNLFPLLKKYRFKAVIFILGDRSIRFNKWDVDLGETPSPLLNSAQIQEMQDYGIEFGAHTNNHVNLTKINEEFYENEIGKCKDLLEKELNKPVLSFSYPYGGCNDYIKSKIKEAGYYFGIATDSGGLKYEDDLLQIFRIQIFNHQGLMIFLKKISASYRNHYYKTRGK